MGAYEVLQPIFHILPEIPKPKRRISLRERLLWTGLVLLAYLTMSQIPLYGIPIQQGEQLQPFVFFQVVMASRRGTLMELGIGPIVTAGIIWELLVGSRIITLDMTSREGRVVFAGVQKILAIVFAAFEALAYILGGAYGALTTSAAIAIFLQLVFVSILVLLMDEMLQKGWGIGSAISLFIAVGVAQRIFWETFSPIGPLGDGLYVGVFPSLVYSAYYYLTTGNSSLLYEIVARKSGYPDLIGFFAMIFFILLLIFLEGVRIEIPVAAPKYGGIRSRIPLKFLYVSNLPVILVGALYSDLFIFTQALWPRLNPDNTNPWFNIIAMYNRTETGQLVPLKGSLVYYLSPPRTIWGVMEDPIRAIVYSALFILFSFLFAIAWVETSGMDPQSQAEQLIKSELQVPGFRRSTKILSILLSRYIWPLTILSGILVGVIAVVSSMLGVLGSGIGILLMVGILVQYQSLLAREQALEMYPMLARLIGE
ncbi:MAG: preprotein translocase subunit SecY [Thermoproteales archaeon]|nr:preprotein translocase subunit SecY [Thermoproteales archaeon]